MFTGIIEATGKVEKMVKDRSIAIIKEHILTAKEILIAHQDTHLDSLAERLR